MWGEWYIEIVSLTERIHAAVMLASLHQRRTDFSGLRSLETKCGGLTLFTGTLLATDTRVQTVGVNVEDLVISPIKHMVRVVAAGEVVKDPSQVHLLSIFKQKDLHKWPIQTSTYTSIFFL